MPSWNEKEEKLEVTGAAAAKVEEMGGPGCSEHHTKGYTTSLPHPRVLWPLHSPPSAPTPLTPPGSHGQIKSVPLTSAIIHPMSNAQHFVRIIPINPELILISMLTGLALKSD